MTEAEKDFIYCAFRMKMWSDGRGSYRTIDADFAAGLLDNEWREYLTQMKLREMTGENPAESL